jgi:hypothetical protein
MCRDSGEDVAIKRFFFEKLLSLYLIPGGGFYHFN